MQAKGRGQSHRNPGRDRTLTAEDTLFCDKEQGEQRPKIRHAARAGCTSRIRPSASPQPPGSLSISAPSNRGSLTKDASGSRVTASYLHLLLKSQKFSNKAR